MASCATRTPPATAQAGRHAGAATRTIPATLASPGATSTTWSLPVTLPTQGDWTSPPSPSTRSDQYDFTSTGATARYLAYPGDTPPTFNPDLLAPTDGTTFTDGRIFVSGRAEDDQSHGQGRGRDHERGGPVHDLVRLVQHHASAGSRRS